MLTYDVLPEYIKKVAEEYNHYNEKKLDVLPSRLKYGNHLYYVVNYIPSLHDLFIREDGRVPPYQEVKRAMFVVMVYQTAGNNLMKTGGKWVKSPTEKLYRKMENKLNRIKSKIMDISPPYILANLDKVIDASRQIVEDQQLIYDCVVSGTDIIVKANDTEVVTEEDQKEVRKYLVEMIRAAVRQNQAQLDTERDREELLVYLDQVALKKPSILLDYLWFKKNEKNMLNSQSKTAMDMGDLQEMVKEDKPIDEMDNAEEILALVRNPKY